MDFINAIDANLLTTKMKKLTWKLFEGATNMTLDNDEGIVFLSYQPNVFAAYNLFGLDNGFDSANPETAIVLVNDKIVDYRDKPVNRYLIFRGDRRKELEGLYPDVDKLKAYWKEEGGHFWSDSLD